MLAMVDCGAGAVVAAGGKDAGLSGDALKTSRLPQLRTISRILVVGMWKLWIELERGVGEEKLETRLGGGSRAVEAMEKEQDGRTAVRERRRRPLCCGLCGKAPARTTRSQHAGRKSTSRIAKGVWQLLDFITSLSCEPRASARARAPPALPPLP